MLNRLICLFISCLALQCYTLTAYAAPSHYLVMIDAGSSHTEVHIYKHSDTPLADIKEISDLSLTPGISAFKDKPSDINTYLADLFENVTEQVPPNTPVYLMATAGMRLIPEKQQDAIYKNIRSYIQKHTSLKDEFVGTISGKMEGAYDWIAVNYLLGNFSKTTYTKTDGVIDMGGASTEVVFSTASDIFPTTTTYNKADLIEFDLAKQHYELFSHSFLGLGQNEAQLAIQSNPACYPKGYPIDKEHTGDFDYSQCAKDINDKLIAPKHVSKIVPKDVIVKNYTALSGFYYTANFFNAKDDLSLLSSQVKATCRLSWQVLKNQYPNTKEQYLKNYCFSGVYEQVLSEQGYHNLFNQTKVQAANKIDGVSTDWTLGAALYIVNQQATN